MKKCPQCKNHSAVLNKVEINDNKVSIEYYCDILGCNFMWIEKKVDERKGERRGRT